MSQHVDYDHRRLQASELYDQWINGNRDAVLERLQLIGKTNILYVIITMMEIARSEGRVHLFASDFRSYLEARNL